MKILLAFFLVVFSGASFSSTPVVGVAPSSTTTAATSGWNMTATCFDWNTGSLTYGTGHVCSGSMATTSALNDCIAVYPGSVDYSSNICFSGTPVTNQNKLGYYSGQSITQGLVCPRGSTLSGSNCISPVQCPTGTFAHADGLCYAPAHAYVGSGGGVSVCDSTGHCTGAATYDTAAQACQSFSTMGVYANAHVTAAMSNGICNTQLVYDDGTVGSVNHRALADVAPCLAGDTVCSSAAATAASALAAALASAKAADAAAAAAAASAAQSAAASAAGAAASAAASASTLAAGGSAASAAQAAASAGAAAAGAAAGAAAASPSGSGGGSGSLPAATDEKATYCSKNPSDPACSSVSFSAPGGSLPDASQNWYVKQYPNGLSGVLNSKMDALKATPLASMVTAFNVSIAGAAGSGCWVLPMNISHMLSAGSVTLCIPSIVYSFLGFIMIFTAVFASRRIIFGG